MREFRRWYEVVRSEAVRRRESLNIAEHMQEADWKLNAVCRQGMTVTLFTPSSCAAAMKRTSQARHGKANGNSNSEAEPDVHSVGDEPTEIPPKARCRDAERSIQFSCSSHALPWIKGR